MTRPAPWVRSAVLAGAGQLIAELGGDPAALARRCGLDPAALSLPDLPVAGIHVVDFLETAAHATARPELGLLLAQRQDLSVLGPLWLTMRSAATLGQALQLLEHLFLAHTGGALVHVAPQAGGDACVSYSLAAGVSPHDRQAIELGVALICREVRSHCGAHWRPRLVQFCHARPPQLAPYRQVLGVTPRFEQDRNAVWIDAAALATPLSERCWPTQLQLARLLARRIDTAQDVLGKVERVMRALLPFSPCHRTTVARVVQLSERSMQRRLVQAGTTFDALRAAVRDDVAIKYLCQSQLPLAQIAAMLGYAEPSVFSRAFRRRHGLSPREARRRGSVPPAPDRPVSRGGQA